MSEGISTEMNNSDILTCKICNRSFSNTNALCVHLSRSHHIDAKTYYDTYYTVNNKCLACGKQTKFKNLLTGYNKYCSRDCANHSEIRINNIKKTVEERYGVSNIFKLPNVREKCEKAANSKEAREKAKQTCLKHFGVEHPMHSDVVKQKMKQTCLDRYNVEYTFQSKEMREKSKQTCLEKYGVDHPWKSTQLKQKQIDEYCLKNNLIPLSELNLYLPNKVLEHFDIKPVEYMTKYFISASTDINKLIDYSNNLLENQGTVIERELDVWLNSLDIQHTMRDFSAIKPLQLDCYIKSKKVAIEIDGIYWHSYNHTHDKNKHLYKTKKCLDNGIRLIHFTDLEWNNHKDICQSIILSALGIYDTVIYARDCTVKTIDTVTAKEFINSNHIDGYVPSSFNEGLFYNKELVQIISIGKSRYKPNEYELLRMCSKLNTHIIGGFSKLMKHQPYNELISYVDRSKFNGNGYISIGFTKIGDTKPNYNYYLGNNKLSRISAQKHKLPKLLGDKFDPDKTEAQNMMDAGYLMLYDCGNYKMIYRKEM